MMACALTGPISGKASSSSSVAVLILTAASANAENSSVTINSRNLFIHPSQEKSGLTVDRHFRSWPDALNAGATLRVDRGLGKQRLNALRDAPFDVCHRGAVPRRAQPTEIGLGVALVLVPQPGRKGDVFDRAGAVQRLERQRSGSFCRATGVNCCGRHGVERRRVAGAQIEDSRALRVVEKVEVDLHNIVDAHKVAALLTGGVASPSPRKAALCHRHDTGGKNAR